MTEYTFSSKDVNTQNGEVVFWFVAHNEKLDAYNGAEFGVVVGDEGSTVVDSESYPIEGNWYVHLLGGIEEQVSLYTKSEGKADISMNIELNDNLENPTAFFTINGDYVALDLVTHELRNAEVDGPIYPELHDVQPEVEQDWENESTIFKFKGFKVVYSGGSVSCEALNKLELTDTLQGWIAVFSGVTGSGEYVSEEEAHNIKGDTERECILIALGVWGAEEGDTTISIIE